ncbi:MAG: PTS fructose transporter subunit IIA [Myxococcales bacterium]|nr:PTS fructose transporter subunit IIA [Myxococcales bacterium]
MIGIVICTHADLAQALLATTEMIVGELPAARAVGVQREDGPERVLERIRAAIDEVDIGDGVVLLCDMFGGTPSNLSLSLLSDKLEVVTGVNLPMLLKLYTARKGPLAEVAAAARTHGRDNILVAGELMRGKAS